MTKSRSRVVEKVIHRAKRACSIARQAITRITRRCRCCRGAARSFWIAPSCMARSARRIQIHAIRTQDARTTRTFLVASMACRSLRRSRTDLRIWRTSLCRTISRILVKEMMKRTEDTRTCYMVKLVIHCTCCSPRQRFACLSIWCARACSTQSRRYA